MTTPARAHEREILKFTEKKLKMEQLVKDISKHSASGEFKLLVGKLQSASDQISGLDVASLDSILATLEPDKHSLGYLAVL